MKGVGWVIKTVGIRGGGALIRVGGLQGAFIWVGGLPGAFIGVQIKCQCLTNSMTDSSILGVCVCVCVCVCMCACVCMHVCMSGRITCTAET